jgi:hypothetical protein
MPEETETKSHSRTLSLAIAFLIALPLLYILSIGPVALCCQKLRGNTQDVKEFYFPVIWLHEHTILKKPLEMYIALWGLH